MGAWERAQSLDKLVAHANRDKAGKHVTFGIADTDRRIRGPRKVLGVLSWDTGPGSPFHYPWFRSFDTALVEDPACT